MVMPHFHRFTDDKGATVAGVLPTKIKLILLCTVGKILSKNCHISKSQ